MHAILIVLQVFAAGAHGPGAPRPGFIALRERDSDDRPKASEGAADCNLACGDDAPKKCVPDCNSAIVQCINVHDIKETQRCRKELLTGIKRVRTFTGIDHQTVLNLGNLPDKTLPIESTSILAADPKLLGNNTRTKAANTTILAADRKLVRNKCAAACGQNVNSSCITGCEMEMYQCIDHTLPKEEAAGEREKCFKKVLEKYSKFQEEWEASHGFVARHNVNTTSTNATLRKVKTTKSVTEQNVNKTTKKVPVQKVNVTTAKAKTYYMVTDADRKMIKDVCNAACTKAGEGAPSSMCITHCETDMYRCIKETLPDEMDERKKCRKDTQAKYESWGIH